MFTVPISLKSRDAISRLLTLLEEQRYDYQIVEGVRDQKGYREIEIRVVYPSIFTISIVPAQVKKFKISSSFSVHDFEHKFEQGGHTYDLDPQLARQHMENLLFKFIFAGERPWNFEKGSFFTRIEPERIAMKQKWERFLGEKL
ncbi:MAG: hypothetical protein HXS47_03035 [Theionarchaea archaeon]|nr:hypothetical protein [Theionarchaea archaeon]